MVMLMNPGNRKKRKSRKSSKRRASSRRRRSSSRSIIKRWACHPSRARYQRSSDVQTYCAPKRRGRRGKRGRTYKDYVAETTSRYKSSGLFGNNPRRRRRNGRRSRARNYSHWIPAYKNPGLSTLKSAVTSGFDLNKIKATLPVVGSFIGTRLASGALAKLIPIDFLKSGVGSYVTDLVTIGVLTAGSGMTRYTSKYKSSVKLGGSLYLVTKIFYKHLLPLLKYTPLQGLADYLTVANAAGARPLNGLGHMTADELAGLSNMGVGSVEDIAGDELESA